MQNWILAGSSFDHQLSSRKRRPWQNGLLALAFAALAVFTGGAEAGAECRQGCDGDNTFLGDDSLPANTNGFTNTAIGSNALQSNTEGFSNTAIGAETLVKETTGHGNIALGHYALYSNTDGNDNVAIGEGTLYDNNGIVNVGVGAEVLNYNMLGSYNTASGYKAMFLNTNGNFNIAYGPYALENNISGSNNIAIGCSAGAKLTTGDNNIDIGNLGVADESGVIRLGTKTKQTAIYVAGIANTPLVGNSVPVAITDKGQLGIRASSARFKEAIKPMEKASEAIFGLKPVTFRYKQGLDSGGRTQFGLVAEDVAKVDPDLVVCDDKSKPFTVRYDEVNAMLLNEFLKEHRKVESLETTVARLEKRLKEQDARIQQVSQRIASGSALLTGNP
jgi:hypothetical protein